MPNQNFTRRLTAILSADAQGYSRLMREDEGHTITTITLYRKVMADLIKRHRGRVIDSAGDNILAEFSSIIAAVNCAAEIQRELAERNQELAENRKMRFRIGINLGDVVARGDRIYGDGVNIAARLEGLADGGGICISGTVYDAIEGKTSLEYEFLGEKTVKNIEKPVRVYKVLSFPGAAAHRVSRAKKAEGRRWLKAMLALTLFFAVGAAAAGWFFHLRPPAMEKTSEKKKAPPRPGKPSIAVLPFSSIGGGPKDDFLGDGICTGIITALSQNPRLFVIARNSSFIYKGKAVKVDEVARSLGVRYVLEGEVQRQGERLRVTAQLIDAQKGHHLWAELYDRRVGDIFALQDEIALRICTSLMVKLSGGEQARLLSSATHNLKAWGLLVKAIALFDRFTPQDNAKARDLLGQAVKLDPKYVSAWVQLAWTHWVDARLGFSRSRRESFKECVALAQKAKSLNPDFCHSLWGGIYLFRRQYSKALDEGEKSLEVWPGAASNHILYSLTLLYTGHFSKAAFHAKEAMLLYPTYPAWYQWHLGNCFFQLGDYGQAEKCYEKVLFRAKHSEMKSVPAMVRLAGVYAAMGRKDQARKLAEEALGIAPHFTLNVVRKTIFYQDPAHMEKLLGALRLAGFPEGKKDPAQ